MGYGTTYNGTFVIEPPLTWAEIRQSEAWDGHPNHSVGLYRARYGTRLVVDEETIDTPDGPLVRRAAEEVEIVGDELRHDGVMDDLRALARLFGATHRFVGRLDCRHDHPDVETPFRVRIVGTDVEEIWPVMFWPDDPTVVSFVEETLRYHGPDVEPAAVGAQRIISVLAQRYTRKD